MPPPLLRSGGVVVDVDVRSEIVGGGGSGDDTLCVGESCDCGGGGTFGGGC